MRRYISTPPVNLVSVLRPSVRRAIVPEEADLVRHAFGLPSARWKMAELAEANVSMSRDAAPYLNQ